MKTHAMIVFISLVLTVHFLVNLYIFTHGWRSLSLFPAIRPYFLALFIILFLSYILARVSEPIIGYTAASVFNWIGSFWFAAMLYFFLFILFIDIFRLFNHWFHFFPAVFYADYARTKFITMMCTSGLVIGLIAYGFINASIVRITKLTIPVQKEAGHLKSLHVVMLSDIHLGTIIGPRKLSNIVAKINALSPDIVLLAGDVVDENIRHVIKQNLGVQLENIKSKYGVFAITGNHEFIGGVEPAVAYLEKHKVKILRDTALLVDSAFWIAGRNDKDMKRFTGRDRKPLAEILKEVDKKYPVILMDHQPFNLEQAAENGADVQFSGHTHNGQMFPLNLITKAIYNPDWGFKKIDNCNFYISCGVGTWGPPVRIGNYPEIVSAEFTFQ
ncbi:MAG TPA: metallophosphoesterase [Bacteroidales bacterium]|nr:metallophosphoesterase [Bacteroidales bacterium]